MRYAATPQGSSLPPYSEVVIANGFAFLSGQVPVDDAGEVVRPSVSDQVDLIFGRAIKSLAAAGLDLRHVVKVQAWLTHAAHFPEFNAAYSRYFDGERYPARSTVVSELAVPVDVEIEFVAVTT